MQCNDDGVVDTDIVSAAPDTTVTDFDLAEESILLAEPGVAWVQDGEV